MTKTPLALLDFLEIVRGKIDCSPVDHQSLTDVVTVAAKSYLLPRLVSEQGESLSGHEAIKISPALSGMIKDHMTFALFDQARLRFEADRVAKALEQAGCKMLLLKGGAYSLMGIKAGQMRRVSDLDILVPAADLTRAERLLLEAGWAFQSEVDTPYNQVYYRHYMHELPPMVHKGRSAVLDVHHRILPASHRMTENIDRMIDASVPVDGTGFYRFADLDLFLHAACHHLLDGDMAYPLRSLVELMDLYDLAAQDSAALLSRAKDVGLLPAASYGLMLLYHCAKVDLPAKTVVEAEKYISGFIFAQMKAKILAELSGRSAPFAGAVLFARSHLMRMPLSLLLPHSLHKAKAALMRRFWYLKRRVSGAR